MTALAIALLALFLAFIAGAAILSGRANDAADALMDEHSDPLGTGAAR